MICDMRYAVADMRRIQDRKSNIGYRKSHIIQTKYHKMAKPHTTRTFTNFIPISLAEYGKYRKPDIKIESTTAFPMWNIMRL
jgi:hypothetical protein